MGKLSKETETFFGAIIKMAKVSPPLNLRLANETCF
jgi:hypothetical protein